MKVCGNDLLNLNTEGREEVKKASAAHTTTLQKGAFENKI